MTEFSITKIDILAKRSNPNRKSFCNFAVSVGTTAGADGATMRQKP